MIDTRVMELGERRRITVTLWLKNDQPFTITEPTWELTQANKPLDTGPCDSVQEDTKWKLTAEIQPTARGDYKLTYIFGLGTEIIRRSVRIQVV